MKSSFRFQYFFLGAAIAVAAAAPGMAMEIKFNTVGNFACNGAAGCVTTSNANGDSTVTVIDALGNTSKLTFISSSDDLIVADNGSDFPAIFEAGIISASGKKDGTNLAPVTLSLKLTQSIPGPVGTQDFSGTVTGKVLPGSSTASIAFASPKITISGVNYTLDSTYALGVGGTPLQGTLDTVASEAAPEPTFLALTGAGFLGMMGIAWSRLKQRA